MGSVNFPDHLLSVERDYWALSSYRTTRIRSSYQDKALVLCGIWNNQ